jgi:hypothetical protein
LFALMAGFFHLKGWTWFLVRDRRNAVPWFWIAGCGGGGVILFFPSFLTLLSSGGSVLEEAVLYEYLFAIFLLGLLLTFARKRSVSRWLILCTLAGLGAWIRPTLVFYGFASIVSGGILLFGRFPALQTDADPPVLARDQHSRNGFPFAGRAPAALLAGIFLFALGCGGLWWTNLKRFGAGFEFGHKLNVQMLYGSMYATRFDDPFQDESLGGAAQELFGALFCVKQLNGGNYYKERSFPGQSPKVRWREFYFISYDWTFVPMLLLGWGAALWIITGRLRSEATPDPLPTADTADGQPAAPHRTDRLSDPAAPENNTGNDWRALIAVLGGWSLLAAFPLAVFYLYTPVISSRYMMDFAPAFAATIAGAWMWIASRCRRIWIRLLIVLLFCGWFGLQVHQSGSVFGMLRSVTWEELRTTRQNRAANHHPSPAPYGQSLEDPKSGIPYDGTGWKPKTGALKPLVILFAKDARFLELELETKPHPLIAANPEDIRAKIGLEFLERADILRTEQGWRVRFHGPRQRRYQNGIQVAFVATVPKEYLAEQETPWILRIVRWNDRVESIQTAENELLTLQHAP